MAYKSGEEGLETLVEVPYPGDGRVTENFSTSKYKKAGAAWNQPYIKYNSTYPYIEGFSKYKKAGNIFLCKKGTRPALRYRSSVTSGSGILSKAADGRVIFTPDGGGTELEIFSASLNVKWFIMDLVGGGGGGAGHTTFTAGGGGGGGGYALSLLQFKSTSSYWKIVLGNGGPGGAGYQLGADGNDSYLKRGAYMTVLTCTGGKGGVVGTTSSPGGSYGYAYLTGTDLMDYSYGYCIKQVNGGKGGDKGNSGVSVSYSYNIPSPENTRVEHTMAGGAGTDNYAGGGGASAVAGGGRGGTTYPARDGVNGQYGSGGGGAGWSSGTNHGGNGGNGYASFYY